MELAGTATGAHDHGKNAACHARHHREAEVERADILVICAAQPSQDKVWLTVMVRMWPHCCRHHTYSQGSPCTPPCLDGADAVSPAFLLRSASIG